MVENGYFLRYVFIKCFLSFFDAISQTAFLINNFQLQGEQVFLKIHKLSSEHLSVQRQQ